MVNFLNVLIGGTNKNSNVLSKSIRINDTLNERSTATISLIDKDGTYRPNVGDIVEITKDTPWESVEDTWSEIGLLDWGELNSKIFSGSIDDLPEEVIEGTSALSYSGVPLVDFHQIADRRIVAEAYESQKAGDIVSDIITKYLASENITLGTVQDGPTIDKAVFNYLPASNCMDELSEITGFQWRINADKTLDFFDRATYTGVSITDNSPIRRVQVRKSRDEYRNKQYLRAGHDISSDQTRTFKGDGETQVFTVDLPIAAEPTITVDGVAKTIGIRGLETGFDWYWQKNDKTISQDDSGTKLTASNTLGVVYKGYYPIIIVSENPAEVESRKTVEGGTGLYEGIEEKLSIDTRNSALEYTQGLLRRHAKIQTELSFETYTEYKSGQLVMVTLTGHDINEEMLVSSVKISELGANDGRLMYSVKMVSGESFGGWTNFFKKLSEKNKNFLIRENEVLVKLTSLNDSFRNRRLEDVLTYTLHQYKICNTNIYCGTGVIL